MNAMIRTRNFGLVGVIALFLTGACASTSVTQAGAANRVATPVKQMSDKELTQRHESLQRSTADLKVRAMRGDISSISGTPGGSNITEDDAIVAVGTLNLYAEVDMEISDNFTFTPYVGLSLIHI